MSRSLSRRVESVLRMDTRLPRGTNDSCHPVGLAGNPMPRDGSQIELPEGRSWESLICDYGVPPTGIYQAEDSAGGEVSQSSETRSHWPRDVQVRGELQESELTHHIEARDDPAQVFLTNMVHWFTIFGPMNLLRYGYKLVIAACLSLNSQIWRRGGNNSPISLEINGLTWS